MDKEEQFIKNKISEIKSKFPNLKTRYRFDSSLLLHLIEIKPLVDFESNIDYILLECDIQDEFESKFENDILFISEDSLCKI